MAKWDKMDKQVWNNSEVMSEYEKLLKRSAHELQLKIEAQQTQEISKKLNDINKAVETSSKGVSNFLDMAKNLADDDEEEIEEDSEPTRDEYEQAKASLLEELSGLAAKAILEKNYKLAYKIERITESVEFDE